MKTKISTATLAIGLAISSQALAFSATNTNVGPLIGPARHDVAGYYATDLGFSAPWYPAGGTSYQILLFGDTYTDANGSTPANNDAVAYFPTAPIGSSAPALTFWGMAQVHDQVSGTLLAMGGGQTPVSSFTSGVNGYWYGVFLRGVYQTCTADSQCSGLKCDTTMGGVPTGPVGNAWSSYLPCWIPHSGNPLCQHVSGQTNLGLCRDQTSSLVTFVDPTIGGFPVGGGPAYPDSVDGANRSEAGKVYSLAMVHEIGAVDIPFNNYLTYPFITNKFTDMTTRASVSDTDYTRPTPTSSNTTVWAWGRPNFDSNASRGGTSELYLAKTSRPHIDAPISFLYYTTAAKGTWSSNQRDAIPLPVTGGWEDGSAGHMSMTYLQSRNQWVMLYGGGTPFVWSAAFGGIIVDTTNLSPTEGFVKMRTAPNPWGPWSSAQTVLAPSDPVIFSTFCNFLTNVNCNPATLPPFQRTPGALYGQSIVEAWDQSTSTTADLGWFVSLWNPYQVQEMKTHIVF